MDQDELFNIIKFYGARNKWGIFSNLYPAEILYNNRKWTSVEQCYQYQKFKAEFKDIAEWLIQGPNQSLIAQVGHLFNKYQKKYFREDWHEYKILLMEELLFIKFSSHESLRQQLLGTENKKLIENAPNDYFWGCGKKGNGKNMLGNLLMKTRDKLKKRLNE